MNTRTAFLIVVISSIIGCSANILDLLGLRKCKCGWKNMVTESNEFSMMAGLVDASTKERFCGATIISERYVLTAAHCVAGRPIRNIDVLVGGNNTTTGIGTIAPMLFRVQCVTIHPKYNSNEVLNNVAVVQTLGIMTYSKQVGPACLPFHQQDNLFADAQVTALGWELLELGGNKTTTLQKVDLNVINPTTCKDIYKSTDDSIMCTYTPNKDTCQMDSGGPILWENPTTHNIILVGITSSGIGCVSDMPSLNTRVGPFIDWIANVTPGADFCQSE